MMSSTVGGGWLLGRLFAMHKRFATVVGGLVFARDGMLFALEGAGWKTCFVVPQDDLEWIHGIWKTQIKKYLNA